MGALFFYSVLKIISYIHHYRLGNVKSAGASNGLQSLGMSMVPDVISSFQHIYPYVNFQLNQASNQLSLLLNCYLLK